MKKKTGVIILAVIAGMIFLGCNGMAELFHGPKPEGKPTVGDGKPTGDDAKLAP